MSFEGEKNFSNSVPVRVETSTKTPFEQMAWARREEELANAEDAVFEDVPLNTTDSSEPVFLDNPEQVQEDEENLSFELSDLNSLKGMVDYLHEVKDYEGSPLADDFEVPEEWISDLKVRHSKLRLDYNDLLSAVQGVVDSGEAPSVEVGEHIEDLYIQYDASRVNFEGVYEAMYSDEFSDENNAGREDVLNGEVLDGAEVTPNDITIVNPEVLGAIESTPVNFDEYKAESREELVQIMRAQGRKENHLEKTLKKSVDKAETPEEIARIKHNILNDPRWVEKAERAEFLEKFDSKEAIESLHQEIDNEVDLVNAMWTTFYTRFPRNRRNEEANEKLNTVAGFKARVEDLNKKIVENEEQDEGVIKVFLEKYLKLIKKTSSEFREYLDSVGHGDIAENINAGQTEGLDDDSEVVIQEPVSEEKVKPFVLNKSDRVDVESVERGEILPTEEAAATILNDLNENQFLTGEERETAKAMHESYLRKVAEGAEESSVKTHFDNFKNFVNDLSENPSVDYLDERLDRIVERVDAGVSRGTELGANLLTTIHTLKENYDKVADAEDVADENKVKAYKLVESHAEQHEDLWLSVCGMRIPKAGPAGVFGARSFREGLILVKDSHVDLDSPEKKVLVNQIIQILNPVPNEGLTEAQVAEITHLAKLIDVPAGVVGSLKKVEQKKSETVVEDAEVEGQEFVDEDLEEIEVDKVHMSVPLTIEHDPGEGDVEIRVANGSEEKIKEEAESKKEAPEIEAYLGEVIPEDGSTDAMGWTEDFDPVNKVVANEDANLPIIDSIDNPTADVEGKYKIEHSSLPKHEKTAKEIMIESLLTPSQLDAMAVKYGTTEDFSKFIQNNISRINNSAVSKLDSWFGERPRDTYAFIKDMSIGEIVNIYTDSNYAEKVSYLQSKGIKYESFMEWGKELSKMMREADLDEGAKFEEVFISWMAYLELGE